jgi:hypothetical protein
MTVLSHEGFDECKRDDDDRPSSGEAWQGVDPRTRSVVSAVWVTWQGWPHGLVFIEVDRKSLAGGRGWATRHVGSPRAEDDPYQDEGGEG